MTTTETVEGTETEATAPAEAPKPKRQRKPRNPKPAATLTVEAIAAMSDADRKAAAEVEAQARIAAREAGKPEPESPILNWMGLARKLHSDTITAGAALVPAAEYLEVTKRYLDKCGPEAKVGTIAKAMRADRVPVGYWLNPCLKYLDPVRFASLKVSNTKVPKGTPVPLVTNEQGQVDVQVEEPKPAPKRQRKPRQSRQTAAA